MPSTNYNIIHKTYQLCGTKFLGARLCDIIILETPIILIAWQNLLSSSAVYEQPCVQVLLHVHM